MKKKINKSIEDFKKFKKYFKYSKPRSPLFIEFMTDDFPDEWLIDIVRYRKKSGVVTDHFVILQKDLEHWKSIYEKDGFTKLTEN